MSDKIYIEPLPTPRVEIINLIDVLITLIAFFIFTTVFADQEQRLSINLPNAVQTEQVIGENLKLSLYLTADQKLYLEDKLITLADLIKIFNKCDVNTVVVIKADRSCQFEHIVQVIDQIKQSKLRRITFAVNNIK